MKTGGAWALSILLASVASNPVMKYSVCSYADAQCEATTFASNSPFEFGNISSGIYFYDTGERFSISCTFHEPLHWIITADGLHRIIAVSSNVTTITASSPLYYDHVFFEDAAYGLIRCESYDNSELAAEMYLARRDENYEFITTYNHFVEFSPNPVPERGAKMIVPCSLSKFDANFNSNSLSLQKIKKEDMMKMELTHHCLSCFPRTTNEDTNCSTSCPYGISERIWIDAGRPLSRNNTGNQWLDCVGNSECAFETVSRTLKMKHYEDCNWDGEITCSDLFSSFTSYPSTCRSNESIYEPNFRKIEACIVKRLAQVINSTEAEYDPRIGFQLKAERDLESVYFCSFASYGVYFIPYHTGTEIDTHLKILDKNANNNLTGIGCSGQEQFTEYIEMDFLECSTLFDCELQLQTSEMDVAFRDSNIIIAGKMISEKSSQFHGKIIQNPPSSGMVHCKFTDMGDLQYYFTGLNSKSYFLSSSIPTEALIVMKHVNKILTTSNEIQVECAIANFIVFPSFEYTVKYSNGTIREIQHTLRQQQNRGGYQNQMHYASHILVVPLNDSISVVSVRCRALLRNSTKYVEATLMIEPDVKPTIEEPLSSEVNDTTYLVAIFTGSGVVLVICSIICATYGMRKYKKSKELRQLTLEEINEFLHGNAALAAGSSNEVNVDAVDFPERYQIPPMDLKMNLHEVLGEGQFGRCVTGCYHNQKVAVKTIKSSVDVAAFKEFLREVKIMAYLGHHENIVQLLGAVVNQLRDRKCFAVLELSPYGDLLKYLRRNDAENPSHAHLYANLAQGELIGGIQLTKLDRNHLIYFCEQIAAGMEFVVDRRVIHGDLAARNILVFPDYVVKITDFGLSRKLYTASNYKKKNATPLPWRWMAIESLKYMEFSPMSDMWAYGITAWEIFNLGQVPYAGIVYSHEFVDHLEEGRRLQRPKNVSDEIYQFIKLTWDRTPSARPSFEDAKIFFRRLSVERK